MSDSSTTHLLEEIVRRESRSLVQYIRDAFPWTTLEEEEALEPLQKLIAEEQEAIAALVRYLAKNRHAVAYLGSYPMAFTAINFVSLEHVLPLLADDMQRLLACLETDVNAITDPEARTLVQNFVDLKRQHLETLKSLAARYPETHSTVR